MVNYIDKNVYFREWEFNEKKDWIIGNINLLFRILLNI